MSFYSSQVGKNSSRYCNSSLYGTNLSSVYADGPPPLDDSTQDEDDDEMVFKDANPPKSLQDHEKVDRATTKRSDFQPWSSSGGDNKTTSDSDFGDFSSFADFSSVFGSTNESKTQKESPCDQSTGTFKNSTSRREIKTEDFSNSDDEFGCFSGGDESDFDDFKGFSNANRNQNASNKERKKDNSVNGLKAENLHSNDSQTSSQHGINQNNIKKSDFFSDDDDDDDFDDFQSTIQIATNDNISSAESSATQNTPYRIQSTEMPSIFSDDDNFGEFSSSSDNNGNSPAIQKDVITAADIKESASNDVDSSHSVSSNIDSKSFISIDGTSSQQTLTTNEVNYSLEKSVTNQSESGSLSRESEKFQSAQQKQEVSVCDSKDSETKTKYLSESSICGVKSSSHLDNVKDLSLSEFPSAHSTSDKNVYNDDSKDDDDGFGSVLSSNKINHDGDDFSQSYTQRNINDDDNFGTFTTTLSSLTRDDDDDFGDFSTISSPHKQQVKDSNNDAICRITADSPSNQDVDHDCDNYAAITSTGKTECDKSVSISNNPSENDAHDFGDFSTIPETSGQTIPVNNNDGFGKFNSNTPKQQDDEEDEFADFSTPTQPPEIIDDDDNFGDFATISQSSNQKPSDNDDDDDSGDFATMSTTIKAQDKHGDDDDKFGHFATFSKLHGTKTMDNDDDDVGAFGEVSSSKPEDDDDDVGAFGEVSSSKPEDDDDDVGAFGEVSSSKPEDDDDDVGAFGEVSSSKPEDDDDDFGAFGEVSSSKPDDDDDDVGAFGEVSSSKHEDDDDGFGDFSSVSQSSLSKSPNNNKVFSECKPSSKSGFACFSTSAKTSDNFVNVSSVNQKPQSTVQSTTPSTLNTTSTIQSEENKKTSYNQRTASTKMTTINSPQKNISISSINNAFEQSFVNVELDARRNMIIAMLQHELHSGKSSVWESVKESERDGSLRLTWVTSDHQLKMLEALSMLPVRIQTSASFRSSGPTQTPLFASGLGLLEPVKGVITPFHHHGVEEINPSQDPFGAPPEVGIPDLGFGGNGGKKDTSTGHPEVKDSMDTISVSSSLDLDFLAPPSSNGDKTESKGLYEDDLLGLGMQFSASNESPKVNHKDMKKMFKLNTTAIALPSDDKNLSEPSKKIVKDFEDLAFMLSKVLMFPLKSQE